MATFANFDVLKSDLSGAAPFSACVAVTPQLTKTASKAIFSRKLGLGLLAADKICPQNTKLLWPDFPDRIGPAAGLQK